MKIVAVFHQDKVVGVKNCKQEIGANPPMTTAGMEKIDALIPALKKLGPYYPMLFTSRMSRAADAASVLAMELDLDFRSVKGLGQAGNLDEGVVIPYPGHENDGPIEWQEDGIDACAEINSFTGENDTALAFSHRPIIGALIAACKGIFDANGINAIVQDKELTKNGFVVFNYNGVTLTLA
jgi:broad specificity phosphatase PhoE